MSARPAMAFVAVLTFLGGCASSERDMRPRERRPNVVIFFIDDLGYADIEPFGAPAGATPNLTRLAAEGTTFTNFHVSQPVCSASRASLLTGCYATRVGIHGALMPWDQVGLNSSETTLATELRAAGYATALFGKWHLGHASSEFLPTAHGFDEYFGLPYSNDMWPGNHAQPFPPLPLYDGTTVIDDDVDAAGQATLTRRLTERAVQFIERRAPVGPFLLIVTHPMVHVPIFAGPEFRGRTGRGEYADVVAEINASVGSVMEALKRTGTDDDTLVIFTSDNGPWLPFGNHAGSAGALREGKGTTFEGGVRVPCVMRWPGQVPAGRRSDAMLMTIDLLPTLAAITGAPKPERVIDGRDRRDVIFGRDPAPSAPEGYAYYYGQGRLEAVVTGDGRWKLVFPHEYVTLAGRTPGTDGARVPETRGRVSRPELYDLVEDLGESHDVAAAHPDIVARLDAYAERMRSELGDAALRRVGTATRPAARAPELPDRFRPPR